MKIISIPVRESWEELFRRPTPEIEEIEDQIKPIFRAVMSSGDEAVQKYTSRFDGVLVDSLLCSPQEFKDAEKALDPELKKAIQNAMGNIKRFHSAQKTTRVEVETAPGVLCWQEKRPIEKVGLYIPGGTAPLFSTILMLAVPAQIAGCREIIMCTPPNKEGKVHPAILYAASLCGVDRIYKVGGVQAVAAMTFGTETIPRVYKIFGPGNQYVTVAKQLATQYGVAIDMPAGPSEVMVVADDSAKPSFVAADLLSQAEHGADSQVVLVTTSQTFLESVREEINMQLAELPRKDLAQKALSNSKLILAESISDALDMINFYGPEHLILSCEDAEVLSEKVINAGSVFLGNFTPESAGDYASGTNHTLPTNGYARQYSGVNLDSFMKSITFQRISEKGIQQIGPTVAIMAEAEGLQAHKNAVTLRLQALLSK
ncbi:histidinol dehydrogenase [Lentiprolixibacter aurantiacus]|uniref:Histidinol dehydrogenase n=1 Tax=Lentiprolixibacter aurantiacus TaxID=2993939 RepID=A0AAE3MLE0_9FLAO|nr:histidinol dehydrogenase [Lentiprolixibacter aurantiacus]MCX2719548.1 histidinol dehydrogenase [Lentiprolixibacter aurantiacus]